MTSEEKLKYVAAELRRMAPAAPTPSGGTSHEGRRAFLSIARFLDPHTRLKKES